MNKAIVLIDLMMKELGFEKYYELADYFGVTAASLSGWVNRNSTKAALKHAAKKGMDSALLEKKLAEIVALGEQSIESGVIYKNEEPQKFSDKQDEKENFFMACEKYQMTLEDIAAAAEIPLDKVKNFKNGKNTTRIFGDYGYFLSLCFLKKYDTIDKGTIEREKLIEFGETFVESILFPKPMFWLIFVCIEYLVFLQKIKIEDIEKILDNAIKNKEIFLDDYILLSSNGEKLIDTCLAKVEKLLINNDIEEFVSRFGKS